MFKYSNKYFTCYYIESRFDLNDIKNFEITFLARLKTKSIESHEMIVMPLKGSTLKGFNVDSILGIMHNNFGPAYIDNQKVSSLSNEYGKWIRYYLNGIWYLNREAWFAMLSHEEKQQAIWNMHE